MKNIILICIVVLSVSSCGGDSKETSPPAKKSDLQVNDSTKVLDVNPDSQNIGLGNEGITLEYIDNKTKKLHEFAENKCKCGQSAFERVGDINKLSESDVKKIKKKYKNCIGEYRTGEIIKIMDKNIVDSYMRKNCPQITSTINRLKNRF